MTPTREQSRSTTRRRVLDAAGQLFAEVGYGSASVRDIAARAGVSVGTVMAVGDKRSLLVTVFDQRIDAEQARGPAVPAVEAAGCADRVLALVEPSVTMFAARPDLARAYATVLLSGEHSSSLFADLSTRLVESIRQAILDRECVTEDEAPTRAEALYLAYVGTLFARSARNALEIDEVLTGLRTTFATICPCEEAT